MSHRFEDDAFHPTRSNSNFNCRISSIAKSAGVDTALQYDPEQLLDNVRSYLGLKNDAALARKLCVQPPVLSKTRHRRTPVSADLLISMHEESGLTIRDLRALMGDRRAKFSPLIITQPKTSSG